jgi:predicted nicotinamide N-methyase
MLFIKKQIPDEVLMRRFDRLTLRGVKGLRAKVRHVPIKHTIFNNQFYKSVWPGARWLAHYVEKYPEKFAGRDAIDIGIGSGFLLIITLKFAGAEVVGIDNKSLAIYAANANARSNGVEVPLIKMDADYLSSGNRLLEEIDRRGTSLLTATDMLYQRDVMRTVFDVLRQRTLELYVANGTASMTAAKLIKEYGLHDLDVEVLQEGEDLNGRLACRPLAVRITNPEFTDGIGLGASS